MSIPVIYTAYANQEGKDEESSTFLKHIEDERQRIKDILYPFDVQQRVKYVESPLLDLKTLIKNLNDYQDHLTIFHFGGHANEDFLKLADTDLEQESIAGALGLAKNLKLVFLNGCATAPKVERLLEKGVPVVIGTKAPVSDKLASQFAILFYENLTRYVSIKRAFIEAREKAKLWYAQKGNARGFKILWKQSGFVWGVYYDRVNRKSKEALQWRIMPIDADPDPMLLLKNRMASFKPDIHAEWEKLSKGIDPQTQSRLLPQIIIRNFPWPIGVHIKAIQASLKNHEKLQQYCSLYIISMKLQINILYSHLWQLGIGNDKLPTNIDWSTHTQADKQLTQRDWKLLLKDLVQYFDSQSITPFTQEVSELFAENNDFEKICDWFQQIISDLTQKKWELGEKEMQRFFPILENYAQQFLGYLSYFARYELKSIKSIRVKKPRHDEPMFKHVIYNLNTTNPEDEVDVGKEEIAYYDSESIYLFPANLDKDKASQDSLKPLNLTPFIIDKNAYKEDKSIPDVFTCAFYDGNHYIYLRSDKDIFVALDRYDSFKNSDTLFAMTNQQADHISTAEESYYELNSQWESWLYDEDL